MNEYQLESSEGSHNDEAYKYLIIFLSALSENIAFFQIIIEFMQITFFAHKLKNK